MLRLFALFLFFIMTANIGVSLVQQIQGREICEIKSCEGDDTNEEGKTEKEKESLSFSYLFLSNFNKEASAQEAMLSYGVECLISGQYATLPERPPRV
jgi:hypothetical protein